MHLLIVCARVVTSSSGEPISVQRVDSINDVDCSHSAAAGRRLSLHLSLKRSSLVLNLSRSQFIDDQTPVYVASDGRVTRWTSAYVNHVRTPTACYSPARCFVSFLPARTYPSAVLAMAPCLSVSVCLSVCYKSVFYRNSCTDRGVLARGFHRTP